MRDPLWNVSLVGREASHITVDLDDIADRFGRSYRAAEPYPHIVLDDVFRTDALDRVLDEWPGRDDVAWNVYDDGSYERGKLTSSDLTHFGPTTREVLSGLNNPPFLQFLERLTGISGLIPDPYRRAQVRAVGRAITPPIVVEAAKQLRRKASQHLDG